MALRESRTVGRMQTKPATEVIESIRVGAAAFQDVIIIVGQFPLTRTTITESEEPQPRCLCRMLPIHFQVRLAAHFRSTQTLSIMQRSFRYLFSSPVFIAVFAFSVRMLLLAYQWLTIHHGSPYGQELGRVASSIAAGRGFSSPLRFVETGPTIWFTPIFPYLVAGIFRIWGIYSDASHMIVQTLNCAFAALTVIPIYLIAKKSFGQPVAIGASWAWVFFPTALFFPMDWIWDTLLITLLLTLIFWVTLAMRNARSIPAWAGYGALWAFGVLVNPSILSLFPFLLGWALWESRTDKIRFVKFAGATLLVFAVALVPWTIRNYRVFGKFIVLRSNFGLELWLGNNPGVPDMWSPWLHPTDDLEEAEKYKRMGEIAYMADKQKEAYAFIRTHPADTANFAFRKFVNNWLAITDSPMDTWSASPFRLKAFVVMNALFSLFALLGALFAYRERCPEALPYAIVLLVYPLIFYLTHSSLRYRFPIDPIMMVLAAYGIAYPIALVRKRFAGQLPHARVGTSSIPAD
jgi:hypothetical protein